VDLGVIDPASDRPVYKQIADQLRNAILQGELREGGQLPSESQLQEQYSVTRMTARNALQVLQGEGLVVAQHGRGVFVRSKPPIIRLSSGRFRRADREAGQGAFAAETSRLGLTPSQVIREVAEIDPPSFVAERLNLRKGAKVVVRRRLMLADDTPMQLADSYIPATIARGTALMQTDSGHGGTYARIEERGHRLARAREELEARMPSSEERRLLRLDPGVPVISLIRTAYDSDDKPVEVFDSVVAADKHRFVYDVPMD
jgi:GntR family transcriptional regulator